MNNSRFEDLEKRAKKIERKKYFKLFTPFLLVIGIAVAFQTYFQDTTEPIIVVKVPQVSIKEEPKEIKSVVYPAKEVKVTVEKQEVLEKVQPKPEQIVIEEEKSEQIVADGYDTVMLKLTVPNQQEEIKPSIAPVVVKSEKKEEKTFKLEVTSVNEEEVLLRNFDSLKDYDNAISLAKLYLQNREYKKAISWAKKSSRLKPEQASPWLVYAQAKDASGAKEDAIKALENYMSYFSSKEVYELLSKLKGEKR